MKLDPRLGRAIDWLRRHQTKLTALVAIFVIVVAGLVLAEVLKELSFADVVAAMSEISTRHIIASILLAALSYFVLTFYDVLALYAMGKPQRYWRAALGSFSAYTFSHNLGFAPITGAAARWRAYKGTNLDGADIARIVVLAGVTFWLGIFVMLGVFLLIFPGALRFHDSVMAYPVQATLGALILLATAGYLMLCARQTGPLTILGWTLPVPTLKQAMMQFALAATDIAIASAALLVLIPGADWALYPDFVVAYVVAVVIALITHAPGGLGVFEAVILVTLPEVDKAALVSALILYRVIYYWGPLLLAALLLALNEARMAAERRRTVQT